MSDQPMTRELKACLEFIAQNMYDDIDERQQKHEAIMRAVEAERLKCQLEMLDAKANFRKILLREFQKNRALTKKLKEVEESKSCLKENNCLESSDCNSPTTFIFYEEDTGVPFVRL